VYPRVTPSYRRFGVSERTLNIYIYTSRRIIVSPYVSTTNRMTNRRFRVRTLETSRNPNFHGNSNIAIVECRRALETHENRDGF